MLQWAQATRNPHVPQLSDPPFPTSLRAEYVGTALAYHAINRMVSALLTDDLLPSGLQRLRAVRELAATMLAKTLRRQRKPGDSLPLLQDIPTAPGPAWAANNTAIGTAYQAFREEATRGGTLLSDPAHAAVTNTVQDWNGIDPPISSAWQHDALANVDEDGKPGAKIALLAALAPYRITDSDVNAWRSKHPGDAGLILVLAFGAITATNRSEEWVTEATAVRGWYETTARRRPSTHTHFSRFHRG